MSVIVSPGPVTVTGGEVSMSVMVSPGAEGLVKLKRYEETNL